MSVAIILVIIAIYFVIIFGVTYLTNRNKSENNSKSFFVGQRKSPWFVVAVAMVGTSISGVTFLSVPGMVNASQFSYMQMVLGFFVGYALIAFVLIPLYYKLNLCSIYTYLDQRFGNCSYKIGSIFFIISKYTGCAVRMYLTAVVLQLIVFDKLNIPFLLNVVVTITVLYLYTFRGGVKTLVWVDFIQTCFMILAVVLSIFYVCKSLGYDFFGMINSAKDSQLTRIFFFDNAKDTKFFWKQFFSGIFTAVAMTGLDQDMMQKNLSCKNIKSAQKNVMLNSFLYIPVNFLFLFLGYLLFQFAVQKGIFVNETFQTVEGTALQSDQLYAYIATGVDSNGVTFLPMIASIVFCVGLIAAAFSSGGSALTALTTSFTVDILKADKSQDDKKLNKTKNIVHLINAIVMAALIFACRYLCNQSVISAVYMIAGYTYGPLLALYIFGLYTKFKPRDFLVPIVCVVSPILCLILSINSQKWFGGYKIGFELLLINAFFTICGLLLSSINNKKEQK